MEWANVGGAGANRLGFWGPLGPVDAGRETLLSCPWTNLS